jgi:hypothetical protein
MYTENGKAIGKRERDGVRNFPFSRNIVAICNIAHPKHKDKIAPEHGLASCTDISPTEYGTLTGLLMGGVVGSGYPFRSILTVRPVDSSQMICLD